MITESEFITKAQPLFQSIYRRNSAGCCLHVIIDDDNWDCLMDDSDLKHKDCRALYALIQELDLEDRERIEWGFFSERLSFTEKPECCPHCGERL